MTVKDAERLKRWKKNHPDRYWEYMKELGILKDGVIRKGPYEGINGCWKGQPAFVVACSQALKGIDLNELNGLNTISVNHLIEDWDKATFHLFLDQRFLDNTTYDLTKYHGTIFQKNNTNTLSGVKKAVRFSPRHEKDSISLNINDGIWPNSQSGVAALTLALMTGASPVYLLGCDSTTLSKDNGNHYKATYTAEVKKDQGKAQHLKQSYYERYKQFNHNDRIINVCNPEIATMNYFKTIDFKDIPLKKYRGIKEEIKTICHVGTMENIKKMGDITRHIYNHGKEKHVYMQLSEKTPTPEIPKADVYILHCFKNSHKLYRQFKKPAGSKVISLIHSSEPCEPAECSDLIIAISNTSMADLELRYPGIPKKLVFAGVKNYLYKYPVDYEKSAICRMSRNNPEKINPESHEIIYKLIKESEDISYKFFCNKVDGTKIYNHHRFNYNTDIKIDDIEGKAYELSKCSIYAIANNTFVDTFSLSLLEAMAAGLSIVLLRTPGDSMPEVLGDAGLIADNVQEWEAHLKSLLDDPSLRIELGEKAKERAKLFDAGKMIEEYDKIIEGILK